MPDAGADALVVRRLIRAPRVAVFRAWTMAGSLKEWFSTPDAPARAVTIEPRAGGRLHIACDVAGGTWTMEGTIRAFDAPALLEFTWISTDIPAAAGSLVRVEFLERPDGTEIVLTQRGFPNAGKRADNDRGWREMLPRIGVLLAAQPGLRAQVRRTIRASPAALYRAWTDPTLASRFLGSPGMPAAVTADVRVGGRFHITMHGPGGAAYEHDGEYLELDPPRRIAFTWESAWSPADLRSVVTITFTDRGGGATDVVLTHERFTDQTMRADHEGGWGEFLEQLERLAGDLGER